MTLRVPSGVALYDPPMELGVRRLGPWIFNCWVISDGGDGRPLIVDLGLASTATTLLGLLAESAGTPPVVIATHLHVDHVAGLASFEAMSDCDVFLPPAGAAFAAGDPYRLPGPREVAKILPVMRSQPFSFAPLREARDGQGRLHARWLCDTERGSPLSRRG